MALSVDRMSAYNANLSQVQNMANMQNLQASTNSNITNPQNLNLKNNNSQSNSIHHPQQNINPHNPNTNSNSISSTQTVHSNVSLNSQASLMAANTTHHTINTQLSSITNSGGNPHSNNVQTINTGITLIDSKNNPSNHIVTTSTNLSQSSPILHSSISQPAVSSTAHSQSLLQSSGLSVPSAIVESVSVDATQAPNLNLLSANNLNSLSPTTSTHRAVNSVMMDPSSLLMSSPNPHLNSNDSLSTATHVSQPRTHTSQFPTKSQPSSSSSTVKTHQNINSNSQTAQQTASPNSTTQNSTNPPNNGSGEGQNSNSNSNNNQPQVSLLLDPNILTAINDLNNTLNSVNVKTQ